MKRRILSSLMALVLVFGLLPVSAMAKASNWGADRPKSEIKSGYQIRNGETKSPSTNFILGNGDGQLRTMPTGSENGQSFNASAYSGVTAVSSDPDVVEVKITRLEHGGAAIPGMVKTACRLTSVSKGGFGNRHDYLLLHIQRECKSVH